jgi:hypothetical protein
MRALTLTLLAAAFAVAAPAAASAATLGRAADGTLTYTAGAGVANTVDVQTADDGGTVVYTSGEPMTVVPSGCTLAGEEEIATCPAAPAARVDLGDGDDIGRVSFGSKVPTTILGGAGNDELDGWDNADVLDGGPGDDVVDGRGGADRVAGGDGNDEVDGGAGSDTLDGGAGDDALAPDGMERASADVVDGGPGFDRIEDDWTDRFTSSKPPVAVTLAGGADDGRPGEGDDVHGVESITTHQASTLIGTDAAEHLEAFQTLDPSTLVGAGGNDELDGGGGADRLDGGAGDDLLDGGYGDDAITGGPGRDRIYADRRDSDCGPLWCTLPYGNDTIDARDGEPDSVTCGAGEDSVTADAVDVVSSDCEHVDRGTPAPGPGPKPQPGGGTARKLALVGHPPLARALRHGLRVRVGATRTRVLARLGHRVVGSGTGKGTVAVRFTHRARRQLAHRRSVKLTLAAGKRHAKVTLRR